MTGAPSRAYLGMLEALAKILSPAVICAREMLRLRALANLVETSEDGMLALDRTRIVREINRAGLSFLGVGIQPPSPSWGNMIADGRDLLTSAPWISLFPGLAIALSVMALHAVADALRDALDPRTARLS